MKNLNIAFCSFPDFSSNAKALYDYMKKVYNNDMNLIWAVNTDQALLNLREQNIEAYKIGTDDYFEKMKDIDVFFTTHANITGEKNEHSLYIELWHGIGPKKSGFLSDNISDKDAWWYGNIRKKIDYYIVPSDFWRSIFSTMFNVKFSRVLALGYPKFDNFLNNNSKKFLEKILNIKIENYNKVIYYMPTFRLGCDRKQESKININNIFNIKEYDEKILTNFLEKNKILLCIKKHPSESLSINFKETNNIRVIKENQLSENNFTINDILNAAELMITDYSSLGVEYTFLRKPVVYLNNDIEEYKKNRGIIFDDIDFWMPGYQANNIETLIKSIENIFSSSYSIEGTKLDEMRKLWFGNLQDGGCKQICDYIFDENQISKNVNYYHDIEDVLENKIKLQENEIEERGKIIDARNARIRELDQFISNIINSKGWKILEKIRKIIYKKNNEKK